MMAKSPRIIIALDHGSDQEILEWLAKFIIPRNAGLKLEHFIHSLWPTFARENNRFGF